MDGGCDTAPGLACGQRCLGDASVCCAFYGDCIADQDACESTALAWGCQLPSDCPSTPQPQRWLLGVFDASTCPTYIPVVGSTMCQPVCDSNCRLSA